MHSLSKTANKVFDGRVPIVPERECREEATDASANDDYKIQVIGKLNVDQIIQGLPRQLLNLQVHQPSIGSSTCTKVLHGQNSQTNQSTTDRKPCHCTLFHHRIPGSTTPNEQNWTNGGALFVLSQPRML